VGISFITAQDKSSRHFTLHFLLYASGHVPGTDFGPVISVQAKKKICDLVQSGIDEGAKCVLDGRSLQVPGFEKGYFVGPTILTDVTVSCC
jgi:malonate-semialdehyde dehydrogenase (acetylating)/methylmalonate-semialdehyde dehydrogenase